MKPGTYLRMRREAAGITVDDVALMIAAECADEPAISAMLVRIEHGMGQASPILLNQLRRAFAFDQLVYRQLVAGMIPPTLCRACACSWCDPCDDEEHGPCAWAPGEADLCTTCARAQLTASTIERTDHVA